MHYSVKQETKSWFKRNPILQSCTVADLGSLNINGSVKDIIPQAVGFDLIEGPGVDVVIEDGEIPKNWKGYFSAVVGVSSLQFCPNLENYKKEVVDLLAPDGLVLLTSCTLSCSCHHTTSSVTDDKHRLRPYEVQDLFHPEIFLRYSWSVSSEHEDMIFERYL